MRHWVIRDTDGTYLADTSRSRGSQGGVARVWSASRDEALRFIAKSDAEGVARHEFQAYELPNIHFERVP